MLPSVEYDFRFSIGHVVTVLVRDEIEIRTRTNPHTTETDLNRRAHVELLVEDLLVVELPVAILVFEDNDPVLPLRLPIRIAVVFDDPQAAAIVDGESDRLEDVGFTGEHLAGESTGQLHQLRRLFRQHALSRLNHETG